MNEYLIAAAAIGAGLLVLAACLVASWSLEA